MNKSKNKLLKNKSIQPIVLVQSHHINKAKLYPRTFQNQINYLIEKHQCYAKYKQCDKCYKPKVTGQNFHQKKNFIESNKKNIYETFDRLQPMIRFILKKYREDQLEIIEKKISLKSEIEYHKFLKRKSQSYQKNTKFPPHIKLRQKSQQQIISPATNIHHKIQSKKIQRMKILCKTVQPFAAKMDRKIKLMKQNNFIKELLQKLPKDQVIQSFINNALNIVEDRLTLLKTFSAFFTNNKYVNIQGNIPESIHRYQNLKKQLQPILDSKKKTQKRKLKPTYQKNNEEISSLENQKVKFPFKKRRAGIRFDQTSNSNFKENDVDDAQNQINQIKKNHFKNKQTTDSQSNPNCLASYVSLKSQINREDTSSQLFSFQEILQDTKVLKTEQANDQKNKQIKKVFQQINMNMDKNILIEKQDQREQQLVWQTDIISAKEQEFQVVDILKKGKKKKRNQLKFQLNKIQEIQNDVKVPKKKKQITSSQNQKIEIRIRKPQKKQNQAKRNININTQKKKTYIQKKNIMIHDVNGDQFKYLKINQKSSFIQNQVILFAQCNKLKQFMEKQQIQSQQYQELENRYKKMIKQRQSYCKRDEKQNKDTSSQINKNLDKYYNFFIELKKQYQILEKQSNPRVIQDFFFNIFKFCLVEFQKPIDAYTQQRFIPNIIGQSKKYKQNHDFIDSGRLKQNFNQQVQQFIQQIRNNQQIFIHQKQPQNIGTMQIYRYSVLR